MIYSKYFVLVLALVFSACGKTNTYSNRESNAVIPVPTATPHWNPYPQPIAYQVYLTSSLRTLPADGTTRAQVLVKLYDDAGANYSGRKIQLNTGRSDDIVSPVHAITNADGSATFSVTSKHPGKIWFDVSEHHHAVGHLTSYSIEFLASDKL